MSYAYAKSFDNLKRRAVDFAVSMWAKGAMITLCYWPNLEGKENLPPNDEASASLPPGVYVYVWH